MRIKNGQSEGYYFEAIAIEESIIRDRLCRYLSSIHGKEWNPKCSLGDLIHLWKQTHPEPISIRAVIDLQSAVDEWRQLRNRAIHSIVQSPLGEATEPVDNFLAQAKSTASSGEELTRCVIQWCKKALPPETIKGSSESLGPH